MKGERERTHGIKVYKIDMSKDIEELFTKEKEEDPLLEKIHTMNWAAFHTRDGKFYVLCDEGVGPETPVTDDDPLQINIFRTRRKEADKEYPRSVDMSPASAWILNPNDIRKHLGEQMDLADFIRVFGSRLETNFWVWYKLLRSV